MYIYQNLPEGLSFEWPWWGQEANGLSKVPQFFQLYENWSTVLYVQFN